MDTGYSAHPGGAPSLLTAVVACFVAVGLIVGLAALVLAGGWPALPYALLVGTLSISEAALVRHLWRLAAPVWWPTAQGRVVGAGAIQTGGAPDAPDYRPVVAYAYQVRGVQYRGWFARPDATAAEAAKHPPGAPLPVRYDPDRPEHATTGLLLDAADVVPVAVCIAGFAAATLFVDTFGAWLFVPCTALFFWRGTRSLRAYDAHAAARRAATPVRPDRSAGPAVASTVEVPAPPAARAFIAREAAAARLAALGSTAFGAVLAGAPLSQMVPEVGRVLLGSSRMDLFGIAFSAFVTLVMVGTSGLLIWGAWHAVADASREVREAVYLETTGPAYLNREVDDEGDTSLVLTVGDRRFGIDAALYERLAGGLPYGRVAVAAHTKRSGRLLGVRQAEADGGAMLTDFPIRRSTLEFALAT